jgi:hypothetical protein
MGENVERGNFGENGKASLNMTHTRKLPRVTAKTPETAKGWAETWKRAMSGENGKALPNVTGTCTLPHVKTEMPENG